MKTNTSKEGVNQRALDLLKEFGHQSHNEGNGETTVPTWFAFEIHKFNRESAADELLARKGVGK